MGQRTVVILVSMPAFPQKIILYPFPCVYRGVVIPVHNGVLVVCKFFATFMSKHLFNFADEFSVQKKKLGYYFPIIPILK